jgi:8-hydroxy-5-deazaflavin:NADPH oxidoreductase
VTTIAVIGAGHIGSKVAEAAVKADYNVIVSNATGPESLARLVSQLGSKARALTVEETAEAGDVVEVDGHPLACPPLLIKSGVPGLTLLSDLVRAEVVR